MVGAKIDTSVKKNVQKEPSISVDEQIAEDESIFKELSNLDYTESQSHFSELVLKLVQSVNFKKSFENGKNLFFQLQKKRVGQKFLVVIFNPLILAG